MVKTKDRVGLVKRVSRWKRTHTKPGNQFLPLDLQAKKIVLEGPPGSWSQPGPTQRPLHLCGAFCSSPDFRGTRSATYWGPAGEQDEQGTDGQMPLLDKFGPQVCPWLGSCLVWLCSWGPSITKARKEKALLLLARRPRPPDEGCKFLLVI